MSYQEQETYDLHGPSNCQTIDEPRFYTIIKAARRVGVPEQMFRKYVNAGKIKTEIKSNKEIPRVRGTPLFVKCVSEEELQRFKHEFWQEIRDRMYNKILN